MSNEQNVSAQFPNRPARRIAVSNSQMISNTRKPAVISLALLMLTGMCIAALFSFNPRFGVLLLAASWKTTPGGIGIPGLTKTYEAALTNRSILPVRVSVCDYVTDDFGHGRNVLHSVERWDQRSREWRFFWGIPSHDFCKPYPLGITSDSRIRTVWLWPGQSLYTDFVAIQACDGLELGDRLRFTITPFLNHAEITVAASPFAIDERPTESDVGFRIRH